MMSLENLESRPTQNSSDSPEPVKAILDSPNGMLDEGVLFIEDRRPGTLPPAFVSIKNRSEGKPVATENFISLSNHEKSVVHEQNCSTTIGDGKESDEDSAEKSLIVEDRNPQLSGQYTKSPRYQIHDNYLNVLNQNVEKKRSTVFNSCWNCGKTGHSLNRCEKPWDCNQIARARQEFQYSKGSKPVYKRYHIEESQRFSHLVPGQLSADLRRALGLESRQLPAHIYMMRRLGYPPGWLQDAAVPCSGITMFDGLGKEVLAPGVEGGEKVENSGLEKYDANKIVQYPGFNTTPPPDTYDDSEYWRCSPMSRLQSVEVMIQRLGSRVVGGYKRKKLSSNATNFVVLNETAESMDSQDMDYEEVAEGKELPPDDCGFVPPLPEEEVAPPPPPSEDSFDKTSLTQLEEQKKKLLTELNDVSPVCGTPKSRVGKICSEVLGTPIVNRGSPFQKLPSARNFSVNICDVINFENLPDSTGKYEQMSCIISKVRSRLSELNDEA